MSIELPGWVFGSLLDDLGEFLGESDLTLERCAELSRGTSADAEKAIRAGGDSDEWWRDQTAYLYALARHHVENEARWRELYATLPPGPGEHGYPMLLDYGCGIGTHTLAFSELGWGTASGHDLSRCSIEFARFRSKRWQQSKALFFVQIDPVWYRRPGLAEDSDWYDLIFMHDVVGHLTHPQEVLQQMDLVLKPGGRLYLTYNNARPTSEQSLHRNAELDFPSMLEGLGLWRESALVWRKPA